MKNQNKGITLIALIITIVVLLILAAVAISSITNDGILSYAQNAAKDYNQAVRNEQDMLQQYVNYLNNHTGSSGNGGSGSGEGSGSGSEDDVVTGTGNWTQTGTTVTNGTVTLTVGDTITNYDESTKADGTKISGLTNVEWKVLGAENGKILLFSTDDVKASHTLSGTDGYYNGITALNAICDDYGQGRYAESARTVTVEDIDRVTGYDPVTANYGSGQPYKYLNEVTYTLTKDADGNVTGIAYSSEAKSGTSTSYKKFMTPDGKRMMSDADWEAITDKTGLTRVDSVTITSDYYSYTGSTYLTDTSSAAYLMLFKEATNTSTNTSYWLGSSCVSAGAGSAGFGLRDAYGGSVALSPCGAVAAVASAAMGSVQ